MSAPPGGAGAERLIFAMGGGGFTMEPQNPLLDDYVLSLARRRCAADPVPAHRLRRHIRRRSTPSAPASRAARASPSTYRCSGCASRARSLRETVLDQDIIYTGGGSMRNLLAIWRAHGLDALLVQAWRQGTVLAGLSAGAMCWFEAGITRSSGPARAARRARAARGLAHRPRRRRARAAAGVARARSRGRAAGRVGARRRRRPALPRPADGAGRELAAGRGGRSASTRSPGSSCGAVSEPTLLGADAAGGLGADRRGRARSCAACIACAGGSWAAEDDLDVAGEPETRARRSATRRGSAVWLQAGGALPRRPCRERTSITDHARGTAA